MPPSVLLPLVVKVVSRRSRYWATQCLNILWWSGLYHYETPLFEPKVGHFVLSSISKNVKGCMVPYADIKRS